MNNSSLAEWVNRSALYVALLVAWIAMLGSLYFSEVAGYVPCTLCWYQRILMYPLAGLLALGLLRYDSNLPYLVIPFSLLGQIVSTYHYLIQKTTIFGVSTACETGVPCTTTWINWFGFVTIPLLALIAFFLITIFALLALTAGEPTAEEDQVTPWVPVLGTIIAVILPFALVIQWSTQPETDLTLSALPGGEQTLVATVAPPRVGQPDSSGNPQSNVATPDGSRLYLEACAACHGPDANGIEHLGKSLVDSEIINSTDDSEALAFIREGVNLENSRNTSGLVMPASGGRPDLTDEQILAIIIFVRSK